MIREMTINDYDAIYALWRATPSLKVWDFEDSKEQIERFLLRNPGTSFVAEEDGQIVGTILCGQDGRRGCIYHMCVAEKYRQRKIGTRLVKSSLAVLEREQIHNVYLVAFRENAVGNAFWSSLGWEMRADINNYNIQLKSGK